jgi:hypothetical protein
VNSQNFSGLFPSSCFLKNTMFRKQDLFPSSGEGGGKKTPTQLGPLERDNLNHCFLKYRTMEKVQKNSVNSVQHTPSSESFQVYQLLWMFAFAVGNVIFTINCPIMSLFHSSSFHTQKVENNKYKLFKGWRGTSREYFQIHFFSQLLVTKTICTSSKSCTF